jgi:hypothetical protein
MAKVYHGTSAKYLPEILKSGIVPRKRTGNSNWDHTVKSRDEFVYLTAAYAPYFAAQAVQEVEKALVLEIDLDKLDSRYMYPDEDAVAQSLMAEKDEGGFESQEEADKFDMTLNELTDSLDMEQYRHLWKNSLRALGNVAHRGPIPPEAITRYVTLDFTKHREFYFMVLDPTISILNYQICGQKYRDMTAWLFGDRELLPIGAMGELDEKTVAEMKKDPRFKQMYKMYKQQLAAGKKVSKRRIGIHVVEVD